MEAHRLCPLGGLQLALSLHEGYPTLLGRACKGQGQDPGSNQHKCSPQELCPFLSKSPQTLFWSHLIGSLPTFLGS